MSAGIAGKAVGSDAVTRLDAVKGAIARAAREEGRNPADVTLIAVSKTFDVDAIRPVLEAGQREFGENRVQEAKAKWPLLKQEFQDIRLHLIGPLQSNKVREAVALFDAIHSVDRPSLARELAEAQKNLGIDRMPELFVQINTGEEPQKTGLAPQFADAFVRECRSDFGLSIVGLMCIPPVNEPPSPHFALLHKIAKRNGIKKLSMGMSGDYEQAVMLGATHVRVGSAIFGARNQGL